MSGEHPFHPQPGSNICVCGQPVAHVAHPAVVAERIHAATVWIAIDDEGTCTWCGVPDMHCQCPDVDTNERSWRADDVADSYEDEA